MFMVQIPCSTFSDRLILFSPKHLPTVSHCASASLTFYDFLLTADSNYRHASKTLLGLVLMSCTVSHFSSLLYSFYIPDVLLRSGCFSKAIILYQETVRVLYIEFSRRSIYRFHRALFRIWSTFLPVGDFSAGQKRVFR